jgi:A/G-specific adenine glycosylase
MHTTAQMIRDKYNGEFPNNYNDLIKLKGIGPYTAAAIASFAYNEAKAVVDGNVYRVLARFAGIYTDINSTEGKKEFALAAKDLLDAENPATHNQAMMELGAMVCKPQNPDCLNCPIQENCFAFAEKEQANLPVKIKKIKIKERFFNYLIFEFGNKTYLKQRGPKDIWQGLFEFPMLEIPLLSDASKVFDELVKNNFISEGQKVEIQFLDNYKHVLTHQILFASFWKITCKNKPNLANDYIEIEIDEIKKFAVPRLLEKLISNDKLRHQLF